MTRDVSIPEQGAALIGRYWDDSAQTRIDIREKGRERNDVFRELRRDVGYRLQELGLTYPAGLPDGKARAVEVSRELFVAQLQAKGPRGAATSVPARFAH